MKLIGRDIIAEFIKDKKDAESALNSFVSQLENATRKHSAEMKAVYKTANLVGACTVFDICRNHYRLIASVSYRFQTVKVLYVLTHKEYDKDKWKKDCNC